MSDQRIAKLERKLDNALDMNGAYVPPQMVGIAIACEIRALRLMLRDEIREAAWRLAPAGTIGPIVGEPIASRKAPLEDMP